MFRILHLWVWQLYECDQMCMYMYMYVCRHEYAREVNTCTCTCYWILFTCMKMQLGPSWLASSCRLVRTCTWNATASSHYYWCSSTPMKVHVSLLNSSKLHGIPIHSSSSLLHAPTKYGNNVAKARPEPVCHAYFLLVVVLVSCSSLSRTR